jgi:flagellar protein FliO/FliZ
MIIARGARASRRKGARKGKAGIMSESVLYVISITLLIGLSGLGVWFARQSLGLTGMPLFTPKSRRIGLVEAAYGDGKRRLLLVRRDNVEHLVLTGGPVDVVLETGIPRPAPALIGLEQPMNGAIASAEPELNGGASPILSSSQPN